MPHGNPIQSPGLSMSETVCQRPCVGDRLSETVCQRPFVRDRVSETVCQRLLSSPNLLDTGDYGTGRTCVRMFCKPLKTAADEQPLKDVILYDATDMCWASDITEGSMNKCWAGVGQVLRKCWAGVGQVMLLREVWTSVGQVLGRCWASDVTEGSMDKCWAGVGQVLGRCWASVGQVLGK
ncbi:hypothetical protein RRG08_003982 [Elysia crispata]|uniref:Uncharacterized protein n=1 Tax=Elysia crispata TaxID=231223 RepID=A0AAE0Y6X5_9GAST|nr:hypothetical protein RRG08_003982 [Elysia crispata]